MIPCKYLDKYLYKWYCRFQHKTPCKFLDMCRCNLHNQLDILLCNFQSKFQSKTQNKTRCNHNYIPLALFQWHSVW